MNKEEKQSARVSYSMKMGKNQPPFFKGKIKIVHLLPEQSVRQADNFFQL